jgi:hypothetical protein
MLALPRTARAGAAALPGLVPGLVLGLLLGGTLGACTGTSPEESDPPESATTALASYDVASASVARGAFCDLVDDEAVADLLGDEPEQQRAWAAGDALPFGQGDVGQEWGCDVSGPDGVTLRAWVFAPPVDQQRARRLVQEQRGSNCRVVEDAPRFGSPGTAVTCELGRGATLVRFAGLFDDAWLTCELHAPRGTEGAPEQLVDRTGRWCVAVLDAASTTS